MEPMGNGPARLPEVKRPIEFLEGHHDRQRLICTALERLAQDSYGEEAVETATMTLDYFEIELPLHIADEEQGLFLLMRERSTEHDGFDELIVLLEAEHETDMELHERLVAALKAIAGQTAADISQNAADAVFQERRLAPVLLALETGGRARRLMTQNFALSLAYNIVMMPLAIAGVVTPLIAAIAMSASSLTVVDNALRLARRRAWTA